MAGSDSKQWRDSERGSRQSEAMSGACTSIQKSQAESKAVIEAVGGAVSEVMWQTVSETISKDCRHQRSDTVMEAPANSANLNSVNSVRSIELCGEERQADKHQRGLHLHTDQTLQTNQL